MVLDNGENKPWAAQGHLHQAPVLRFVIGEHRRNVELMTGV